MQVPSAVRGLQSFLTRTVTGWFPEDLHWLLSVSEGKARRWNMSKELKEVARGEDWRQFRACHVESTKRMWYGQKAGSLH